VARCGIKPYTDEIAVSNGNGNNDDGHNIINNNIINNNIINNNNNKR
jgi:hypothetical protein